MPRRQLLRRVLLSAAAVLIALTGAYFFLRDASTFAVRDVEVQGASGPDAARIEAALRQAARDMTTLNVSTDELAKAVDRYPTVKSVQVDRDLPRGLTVSVLERRPVAVVEAAGRKVPLAADGRLLQGATPPEDVPALDLDRIAGARIDDAKGRQLVALVAAAPEPLRRRTASAALTGMGLTLEMKDGPELYFGDGRELRAKWRAVARVLSDPGAEGATYVDVRVPERAAAGGLAPLAEAGPEAETGVATGDPPVAAPAVSTSTGA